MPASTSPTFAPEGSAGLAGRLRTLARLARGMPAGDSHAARLDGFYAPQASGYDAFRARLLHGARDLCARLPLAEGSFLVELGCGTGRTLDLIGPRVDACRRVELVDLCRPLLDVARRRAARHDNVSVTEADATCWRPREPADCVVLSYALSMIPDWFAAVDNALAMLAPGGVLAVTDFYVSRPHPAPGSARHGAIARTFWPLWFRHDGVWLSHDHLPYLVRRLDVEHLGEHRGSVPMLPGVRVPYYVLVGRPRTEHAAGRA